MTNHSDSTDLSVSEVYEFISKDSICVETDENGNSVTRVDENYQNFIQGLISIEDFVVDVIKSDDSAFVMTENIIERNDLRLTKNNLQRLPLAKYFTTVIPLFENYSTDYDYIPISPNVALFYKCCIKLELGREWFNKPLAFTSKQGKLAYEVFNELLDLIRIAARDAEFRGELRAREYNTARNIKSAVAFLTQLFKRRQLVLRVDFSYLPKFANEVTAEEAQKDLAHFLYNFRRNQELSKNLEGYIWKWEFSPLKKMHCHLLFFYDGSKIQNDEFWGNRIGTYWRDVITKGRGMYYNGNTKENKAKFEKQGLLGIGMIGRIHENPAQDMDKGKRDILFNRIVAYLLKAEQFVLAKKLMSGNGRFFGKGRGTTW